MSDLDKRKVVCPLSLSLGVVQNYRVNERPNKGVYESRPVKGTDKYAEAFYKVLHAPEGEKIEVEFNGRTFSLTGLGQADANALKFSHEVGTAARQKAIQMVNSGDIRAPKKNWDAKFVPEGGTPLEELKSTYPEVYNMHPKREEEEDTSVDEALLEELSMEGEAAEGLDDPLEDEDHEAIELELESSVRLVPTHDES